MSRLLLLIHSYGGANETVARHWPYYCYADADRIVGVGTEKLDCVWPDGVEELIAGDGLYMNGRNLPTRLMETIRWTIDQPEEWSICIEYDTIILTRSAFAGIRDVTSGDPIVLCHRTGGRTFDAQAPWFSHNPWVWNKAAARVLVPVMERIIGEGHCDYGKADSSPDVFWGYACERSGVQVLHNPWRMHTRNSFDIPGSLQEACAVAPHVDVIHGVKHPHELIAIEHALANK